MTHTVAIMGAAGAAGIGATRCLKEYVNVLGMDSGLWGHHIMEAEDVGDSPYDMLFPVPDTLVKNLPRSTFTFLPSSDQVKLCQDKAKTAQVLGELSPKTYWLRDTDGAGGKGAQMLTNYLPGKNFSVEFVFHEGKLLGTFCKERISYSVNHKTDGLENRGSSMVSVCRANVTALTTASMALQRIKDYSQTELHGFYGVDLKEDEEGVPRVTEINAGRLLTASYSYYYLTGYNLPLLGVKAFFGEDVPPLPDYPEGYGLIRQMDQLPKLISPELTTSWL